MDPDEKVRALQLNKEASSHKSVEAPDDQDHETLEVDDVQDNMESSETDEVEA